MYIPKHNAEIDEAMIRQLVRAHSFGTLIVPREDGGLEITHLPFLLDDSNDGGARLRVHVARANRIWRDLASDQRPSEAIVVFHGPHGYVSPTWYERGKEDVPTWNYAVVHAHLGKPELLDKPALVTLLDDLAHENETGAAPWLLSEHPAESREQLLAAIAGFSLPVVRWEAKLKLSQNRTPADHARVADAFDRRGTEDDREMAALMRTRATPIAR